MNAALPVLQDTVRSKLFALVLAFMVPTVLAALASIIFVYQQERSNFDRGVAEAARALSLVVDRELASREAVVRTISLSPTLDQQDLTAFYNYASQVAPTDDTVIVLADTSGQQLVNTRRQLGDALPKTVFDSSQEHSETGPARVSDLYFAPLGKQFSFAVRVPVVRDGRTVYYLSLGGFAKQLQKVLSDQRLPPGWIGSVIDRRGVIVARSIGADAIVGKSVTNDMLQRLGSQEEGAFQTTAVDGAEVYASFSKSATYGWGFIIGVPQSPVSSAVKAAAGFGAAAALLIAAALAIALRVGRRLVDPVLGLVGVTEALGRGELLEAKPTGLLETDKVYEALAGASVALHQSNATMKKRVAEALADAEKAQQAVVQKQRLEAVGRLTGGVAHDFNNLLMVVSNNIFLMRQTRREWAEDAYVARIERAVSTGVKLTRQLLAFSRKQALRPEVVDLADRLPDLLGLIRASLPADINVSLRVIPGTAPIEVDPAELELAIINLTMNARDAMKQEAGVLTILARDVPGGELNPGGPQVMIEVMDSGRGIEPDVLHRVFEPFFTTKEVGHGTGLGLSQVYGFATQAGGTATIESEPGRGTKIRLLLPACTASATEEDCRPHRPMTLMANVLLVEDNAELGQVTQELLELAGCRVQRAMSGDEALLLLKREAHGFDAVLSDIRMPGVTNGIALADYIQSYQQNIAVVLMTGYSSELSQAALGDVNVLQKPCSPQALLDALSSAIKAKARNVV